VLLRKLNWGTLALLLLAAAALPGPASAQRDWSDDGSTPILPSGSNRELSTDGDNPILPGRIPDPPSGTDGENPILPRAVAPPRNDSDNPILPGSEGRRRF